jgi:hypothetical protein
LSDAPSPEGSPPSAADGAEAPDLPPGEEPPPVDDTASSRANETIVINTSASTAATPESLFRASEQSRRQRANSQKPVAVINNENLAEHAEGGQLTVAGESGDNSEESAEASTTTDPEREEEYWRSRGLSIRLDWKDSLDRVDELQSEVGLWRRRFYDEDDPFFRDNEIKPSWDRAIEELEAARSDVTRLEEELDDFMEEGRIAGALPGWLREGIDLEPPRSERDSPATRRRNEDPREPKILNEEAINP